MRAIDARLPLPLPPPPASATACLRACAPLTAANPTQPSPGACACHPQLRLLLHLVLRLPLLSTQAAELREFLCEHDDERRKLFAAMRQAGGFAAGKLGPGTAWEGMPAVAVCVPG